MPDSALVAMAFAEPRAATTDGRFSLLGRRTHRIDLEQIGAAFFSSKGLIAGCKEAGLWRDVASRIAQPKKRAIQFAVNQSESHFGWLGKLCTERPLN